jgi:hypothetical protein
MPLLSTYAGTAVLSSLLTDPSSAHFYSVIERPVVMGSEKVKM